MRVGPPPTPAQIREEFDYALREYILKGQLLPSSLPFNDETTKALEQIALTPNPSSALIAAARAALERQLALAPAARAPRGQDRAETQPADHYFTVELIDAQGEPILSHDRFRTPQGALRFAESVDGAYGSIWYQDTMDAAPLEVFRYNKDGSLVDVQNYDGTNHPLSAVPDSIEPGAMAFSLWLQDADGRRVPYDFGFLWDGKHSADWQCWRGDDRAPTPPICEGTITWSNSFDPWPEDDQELDDLGWELRVTYTSSSPSGVLSGETVIVDAAVQNPMRKGDWVETAKELFEYLRAEKLI